MVFAPAGGVDGQAADRVHRTISKKCRLGGRVKDKAKTATPYCRGVCKLSDRGYQAAKTAIYCVDQGSFIDGHSDDFFF